jgi:TrmH family RNA methyltransferase
MDLGAPITSRSNVRVKALRASLGGDASHPGDLLGIEGEHLIGEAMRSQIVIETIYVRAGSEAILQRQSLVGLHARNWVLLARDVFASAVDTAAPQGIAATVVLPQLLPLEEKQHRGMLLALEGLQDPGNLGTLIRSAEAFGAAQIFVTPDTVNPWNPKAVRASAGSVFRMPVSRQPLEEIFRYLSSFGVKSFAAVAGTGDAVPVMNAQLLQPCAIVIGNEGAGLSDAALRLCSARVNIPCAVESLNAAIAGSTLMYEAMRQDLLHASEHTKGQATR